MRFQLQSHIESIKQHRGWFILWGICLVALGTLAIVLSVFTTLATVITLGIILLAAGAFMVVDSFKFWLNTGIGFAIHLIMSLLYMIIGLVLIISPVLGAISITFVLGVFFVVIGLYRTIYSISLQFPRWGWMLFNGIITVLLGILILANWPISGLFAIGLFLGIDIILIGWTYITLAILAKGL
jgi:uncharacterized membrane protein HdeD (DUF308 family)